MKNDNPYLDEEEQRLLLRIARDSLRAWVIEKTHLDLESYPLTEKLREKRGAFVTLHRNDELRGCIGYTKSHEPLAVTVRDNTINAAARDPRFNPVQPDELDDIGIEISALCPGDEPGSSFIAIEDTDEIVIGRDGLYLEHAGPMGGGLLLPQVPAEQGWNRDQFLAAICQKADAPPRAWELPGSRLYRFSAQVFGEKTGLSPAG
jgi:AmmeMemoRadiSam system protein A